MKNPCWPAPLHKNFRREEEWGSFNRRWRGAWAERVFKMSLMFLWWEGQPAVRHLADQYCERINQQELCNWNVRWKSHVVRPFTFFGPNILNVDLRRESFLLVNVEGNQQVAYHTDSRDVSLCSSKGALLQVFIWFLLSWPRSKRRKHGVPDAVLWSFQVEIGPRRRHLVVAGLTRTKKGPFWQGGGDGATTCSTWGCDAGAQQMFCLEKQTRTSPSPNEIWGK